MKSSIDHINALARAYEEFLAQEERAQQKSLTELGDAVRILQGDTADRRLRQLSSQIKQLQERADLFSQMARDNFLDRIKAESAAAQGELDNARLGQVLTALTQTLSPSLRSFCETLLDQLLTASGAERGFVLYYLPETTEAEIIAARHFETTNLSMAEYDLSRTLLREVFARGAPLLLEDAAGDSAFGREESVRRLEIKSVLGVPLVHGRRTVGALYLENRSLPCAFNAGDLRLIETVARFVVFFLSHARLLPLAPRSEERVFLDSEKVSGEVIGEDPKLRAALSVVARLADSPALVLIEGESGTGKELFARALHYQSARRNGPFVAINCAAIPGDLLESELFGHERGAFTGATERYTGRVEQAQGGTLFLDEVSELAYSLQAKLLRFLQGNELQRLGGKEVVKVDVRVVAATSRNLKTLTDEGKFREALFYRLNVIPLYLPALRERKDDIPLLARHYVQRFSTLYQKQVEVEEGVYECLRDYAFPGNVRELENLLHRVVALANDEIIRLGDLPAEVLNPTARRLGLEPDSIGQLSSAKLTDYKDLRGRRNQIKRLLAAKEREMIDGVLKECNGNLTQAARRLGIHRITLHKILGKGGE